MTKTMLAALCAIVATPAAAQVAPPQYEDMYQEQEAGSAEGQIQDQPPAIPQIAPPVAAEPSRGAVDKRDVKVMQRRIEGLQRTYETLGRCTAFLPPELVANVLGQARSIPAAAGLLTNAFERGFRSPKGEGWCAKRLGTKGMPEGGDPDQ